MSYIEKRKEIRPQTGESPFGLNEVFFSRTDERGVIQAANYIFRRVAHYDWDEILGAPHNIVRHEDMPKAVFWLLWDTIKRGEPIGAYVKNKAKDGLYYWVFATVMPCPGGFLSARIKPSSAMFERIQEGYATLLEAENNQGVSPAESADKLLELIQNLGFDDYHQFAAQALSEELSARDIGLGNPGDNKIRRFRTYIDAAEKLRVQTDDLIQEFETMHAIPHNMRVIAARLEPASAPVSVLSKNYGVMSREISDWFEQHVVGEESNFSTIKGSINNCMFLECLARILTECALQLNRERRLLGNVDLTSERQILNSLQSEYVKKSASGLAHIREEAGLIVEACKTMHRQVLGLSTIRVMCKIEGARLSSNSGGLGDIINQLDTFQSRIVGRLDEISEQAGVIQTL